MPVIKNWILNSKYKIWSSYNMFSSRLNVWISDPTEIYEVFQDVSHKPKLFRRESSLQIPSMIFSD